ncbi:MAG: bifunctional 5,10-methylene-tetrahydrofolate dehydrogenase/5,10-methylene-tetrahydrofolate cyclohydrolase [Armatimonadota bacterium]
MPALLLDGLSKKLRESCRQRVLRLAELGITPRLDVVVATQDPASLSYVRMKRRWAEAMGVAGETHELTERTTQAEFLDIIRRLNADPAVHGVLIQHPAPKQLDEDEALLTLGADKDVDGITPASLGRLACGLPGFQCATPLGIMRMLQSANIPLAGKRAIVIGRSNIVGKPMALMLLSANCTVTIAHSKTEDLADRCREADILVAAVGRAEMVRGDWIQPGTVVVDAGYNKIPGHSGDVGDVHFNEVREVASWITPVPGGVGPMTVASLLSNAVDAAEKTIPT